METAEKTVEAPEGYLLDEETGEHYVQGNGKLRLYLAGFTGTFKGLQYHYPQFASGISDSATDEEKKAGAFEALKDACDKYGADKVLYLFNTALGNNVATKVRNSRIELTKDDEENKKIIERLVTQNPMRFSVEDATNFQPGEREISYAGWLNKAKEAGKKGQRELAIKYGQKAFEVLMRDQVMAE